MMSSNIPRQAIVTVIDTDGERTVNGLAQIQGQRIIVKQANGAWHNYPLKNCIVIWDPERRRKGSGHTNR